MIKNNRLDAVGQHGPFRRNPAGRPHDAGYVDGESRRALQDSTREVNQLIEQRRYQQLKQQRLLAEPEPAAPALPQSAQCLPIAGVYLQGVTLLSPTDLSALSALPENCISSNDINRLTRELTRLYVQKAISPRACKLFALIHRRIGVKRHRRIYRENRRRRSLGQQPFIISGAGRQTVEINRARPGIDQANRLQSNTTKLDILPGRQVGGSVIRLRNQHAKPWLITAGTDNYGQKAPASGWRAAPPRWTARSACRTSSA